MDLFRCRTTEKLNGIIQLLEEFMATALPGLAALQTFANTTFPAFVAQQTTDTQNLTTSINTAIAALQSSAASEDAQVQAAVTSLNSALATLQGNETNLEALNSALSGAEAPAATPAVKKG